MREENDLWKLVREKIYKKESFENVEEKIKEHIDEDNVRKEIGNQLITEKSESLLTTDFTTLSLFKKGIFAGFVYIFVIMIILGVLTIPGSITAAVGGFFGGKKAGDPARALTAAMLPFLIIAGLYFLASTGALPPGSGPNDVAEEVGNLIGHKPDEGSLGPISKMPDSNSSVFISVVTFAFIGGLMQTEKDILSQKTEY